MSSLIKQEFILNELNQVGANAKQHDILKRLLGGMPETVFYAPRCTNVDFPNPNDVAKDPSRESWGLTLTYELRGDGTEVAAGLAKLYVELKDHINETSSKGSLDNALSAQGVLSAQFNQYMAGVQTGHWLLTDALIIGASLEETLSEGNDPTHVHVYLEFNAVVR